MWTLTQKDLFWFVHDCGTSVNESQEVKECESSWQMKDVGVKQEKAFYNPDECLITNVYLKKHLFLTYDNSIKSSIFLIF